MSLQLDEDGKGVAGTRARARIYRDKLVQDVAAALEVAAGRVRVLALYERAPEMPSSTATGARDGWQMAGVVSGARSEGGAGRGVLVDIALQPPMLQYTPTMQQNATLGGGGGSAVGGVGGDGSGSGRTGWRESGARQGEGVRPDLKTTRELAYELETIARNKGSSARQLATLSRLTAASVHADPQQVEIEHVLGIGPCGCTAGRDRTCSRYRSMRIHSRYSEHQPQPVAARPC